MAATRVEFRGTDGKALATMLVGRKYFKAEPENPDKAIGDGRFILLPADDKTVYIVSDSAFPGEREKRGLDLA
jgi:hypothetical protein